MRTCNQVSGVKIQNQGAISPPDLFQSLTYKMTLGTTNSMSFALANPLENWLKFTGTSLATGLRSIFFCSNHLAEGQREREWHPQVKSCLAPKSDWTSTECVLPLCLARYRPRRIIEHSVTKTTTATIPPIRAWSGPVCVKPFGSREGETKKANVVLHRGKKKNDRKIDSTKFYTDHP